MQVRPPDDSRVLRTERQHAAPGLSVQAQRNLRDKWIRQGRRCIYCHQPADTLDHVVPLVRGGTNYEGNLALCCKRCNSSKAGALAIMWRLGRSRRIVLRNAGHE